MKQTSSLRKLKAKEEKDHFCESLTLKWNHSHHFAIPGRREASAVVSRDHGDAWFMVLVEQTCVIHKHLSVRDYLHDGWEGENKQASKTWFLTQMSEADS